MTEKAVEASPKKKSSFGAWLLVYAWILLMAGGAVLFMLNNYLTAYEESQVKYTLADYQENLEKELPQAAAQALAELNPLVQSPEENRRWALELLQGATLVKDVANSQEDRPVYWIKTAGGDRVGAVTFGVVDLGRFGTPVWSAVEERFDFSAFYQTTGVTVPADYQVWLGGLLLGEDCVVETGIPFDALEDFYPLYQGLPTMVRYESVPFVGSPELRVCDAEGRELKPEELNQAAFLDRCTAEDRAAVEDFIPDFIHDYVFYSADVGKSAMNFYNRLMAKVVPGSQLATRINQAVGSFGYSNTRDLEILSIEVGVITEMGEGRFLVDVHYKNRITALGGPVDVEDQARIVLREVDGELLAEALFHY